LCHIERKYFLHYTHRTYLLYVRIVRERTFTVQSQFNIYAIDYYILGLNFCFVRVSVCVSFFCDHWDFNFDDWKPTHAFLGITRFFFNKIIQRANSIFFCIVLLCVSITQAYIKNRKNECVFLCCCCLFCFVQIIFSIWLWKGVKQYLLLYKNHF